MSRYIERARVTYASDDRQFFVMQQAPVEMFIATLRAYEPEDVRMIRVVIRDTDNASKRTLFADYPKSDDVIGWLDLSGGAK